MKKIVSSVINSNKEFFDFIQSCIEEKLQLFPATAQLAIIHTLRCLVLKAQLKADHMSLPPLLDKIWHEMILNTKQYAKICQSIGLFVHHTTLPDKEIDVRVEMLRLEYERVFGPIPVESMWRIKGRERPMLNKRRQLPRRNVQSKYQGQREN